MTQIVENWARIAGRVEAWEPPAESGGMGTLTVRVETVSDIPRHQEAGTYKNLLKGTEGQSLRIQLPAAGSRGIPPVGERLELDVRRGRSPDHVFARPSPFPP
jgi:hypothetical protein